MTDKRCKNLEVHITQKMEAAPDAKLSGVLLPFKY